MKSYLRILLNCYYFRYFLSLLYYIKFWCRIDISGCNERQKWKKNLKMYICFVFSNMTLTRLMSKHKGGLKHGILCYALLCSRFEIFSISISSNFKIGKCFIVLIFWKHVFYFFFYTNMIFYVLSTSVEILKKYMFLKI